VGALSERLYARQIELGDSIRTIVKRAQDAQVPLHKATVYKYLNDEGAKRPPEHTIRGLAAGFELSEGEIRRLLGMPSGEDGLWRPPEESARLSRDERDALDRLIKVIARSHEIVTSALSDVVADEPGYDLSEGVAEARQVGETRASTRRRTPGPGARKRTSTKKAKKHATAPTDANTDAAL
jgi:hypothetical protein